MWIIVPSRRYAARLLDRAGSYAPTGGAVRSRAVWSSGVLTPRELLERGIAAHPDARPVLSALARSLAVSDLVGGLEPEVRALFGPGIEGTGAARAIGAAIAELRAADLPAVRIAEASGDSRRLKALACALDAWERWLDREGVWDEADALRAVTGLVREGSWPAERLDELQIRGIYDVKPLQGRLLVALARRSDRTRVDLPFEPGREEATRFAFPYLHLWESITDPALDVDVVHPAEEPPAEVEIVAAADPADEARRTAAWARRMIDGGCPAEEIGIVVGGSPRRVVPVARELERRGVAAWARRGIPLADTPMLAAALLPFRLLEEGFRRDDLEAWVASPATTALDPEMLLPALARGPATSGRASEWKRAVRRVRGTSAARFNAALETLEDLARTERSAEAFWEAYGGALSSAGLEPESWEMWDEALAEVEDALRALGRWHTPQSGWRTHRRALLEAIGDRRGSIGRPGRGVSLLTPYDARGLDFRHGAVIGLSQGALVLPDAALPILGDRERRTLDDRLGERLFRTSSENALEGPLLLAERIRSTHGTLRLSWPVEDEESTALLPALELEDVRRDLELPAPEPPVPLDAPGWRDGIGAERVAALQTLERDRSAFLARDPEARRGAGGRHDGSFAPERAADLAGEVVEGPLARWSASALETWRTCPHRFFQRYILRVRPPDARPVEAEPRAVGTLAHRALHLLYERGFSGGPPSNDRIGAALADAAEEIGDHERGDPAVWEATIRRVAAVLERYFAYLHEKSPSRDHRPAGFEVEFGFDADTPGIEIPTAHGAIELGGRIDRIDRHPDTKEIHVVDYKYARVRSDHREAVDEAACGVDRFQLFAYFLGAISWARAKGMPTPPRATGALHCIRQPRIVGDLVAPAPETIRRRIAEAVEDALAGRYDPSPRDPSACEWCDYRRTCRIASAPIGESAPVDPQDER